MAKKTDLIYRALAATLISFVYTIVRRNCKKGYKKVTKKNKLGLGDQAIINGICSTVMTPLRKIARKLFRFICLPHV